MQQKDGFVLDPQPASQAVHALRIVFLLIVFSLVLSCARRRTITREELSSDLVSAISVANETEMSINFATRGQATRSFAMGHFQYLANQLRDSTKELADSPPSQALEQTLSRSRAQVNALSSELKTIVSEVGSPEALSASKQRVDAIRQALEKEKSRL